MLERKRRFFYNLCDISSLGLNLGLTLPWPC